MTATWASLRWAAQRRSARDPRYGAVRAAAQAMDVRMVEVTNDRTLAESIDAIARDHSAELVVLVPCTDTGLGRLARESSRVLFVKGRVHATSVSPSAVVYIGDQPDAFTAAFRHIGIIVELETAA